MSDRISQGSMDSGAGVADEIRRIAISQGNRLYDGKTSSVSSEKEHIDIERRELEVGNQLFTLAS